MFFFKNLNRKKISYIVYFTILTSFIYALYFYTNIYDPHHHGLMFSNALDLLNAKTPYKEIFIQYGILTTLLHAITLKLFGFKVYFLNVFTIFIYTWTIFIINKIVLKLTNNYFFAYFTLIILIFNHPIPWVPWSNYVAFFFLTLSVFFLLKNNYSDNYFFGFFLSLTCLSRQDYFIPIIFSLFFFLFLNFYKKKIIFNKTILGFFLPIIFFFIYLIFINAFSDWIKTLYLPKLYLEYRNTNLFDLFNNFIHFFIFESLKNFIVEPQFVLILIILITNFYIVFISLFKNDINNFFLSLLTLSLTIVSLNIELFRFYTSVSLGVIILMFFLKNLKNNDFKNLLIFIISFFSLFSFIFYPSGNNPLFLKAYSSIKVFSENPYLSFIKIDKNRDNAYKNFNLLKNQLYKNCVIKFAENLTFDSMISVMLEKNRNKIKPFVKSDSKDDPLETFFDKEFISKINIHLTLNDTIIVYEFNNYEFEIGSINFPNNYDFKVINLNSLDNKPKLIYIYYPRNCLV